MKVQDIREIVMDRVEGEAFERAVKAVNILLSRNHFMLKI